MDVIVAGRGRGREMPSEIHVGLPGGFHKGGVAHVGFSSIFKAGGEGIVLGSAIGGNSWGVAGFGGPNVLTDLV